MRRPFVAARFEALLAALPFKRQAPPNSSPAAQSGGAEKGSTDGRASTPSEEADSAAFEGVLRSKGFVWLDTDASVAFYWSQVCACNHRHTCGFARRRHRAPSPQAAVAHARCPSASSPSGPLAA